MKRILVTGAAGQLGAELAHMLGAEAMPIDIDQLDLTDGRAVASALAEMKPEVVINCAAYTRVDQAESEPKLCRAVNALAVGYLADACEGLDCPLVQISTDYVFGDPGTVPFAPGRTARTTRPRRKASTRGPSWKASWRRRNMPSTSSCGPAACTPGRRTSRRRTS